ncbi:MAG: hypothetical protein ABIQ16_03080 [Polyangiaceae bacterium]
MTGVAAPPPVVVVTPPPETAAQPTSGLAAGGAEHPLLVQLPAEQVCPALQALPQLPQF